MTNSGASLANGASPCTNTNSSIRKERPVSRRPSAKGSAASTRTRAQKMKMPAAARRRFLRPRAPMTALGPTSSVSSEGILEERMI